MDNAFFSWLATQPYSIEVTIGAVFVIFIAPAVLVGMAAIAAWAERLIEELVRRSGLMDPVERERKNQWKLRSQPHVRMHKPDEASAAPKERSTRATG